MLLAISGANLTDSLPPSVLVASRMNMGFVKLSSHPDLNKSKRRLSDAPSVKPGYLEGGASGRLPRIVDVEVAALSNRW